MELANDDGTDRGWAVISRPLYWDKQSEMHLHDKEKLTGHTYKIPQIETFAKI